VSFVLDVSFLDLDPKRKKGEITTPLSLSSLSLSLLTREAGPEGRP
jgi:hypothetical protein